MADDPCGPAAPRCGTRYTETFKPGISFRRIPSCSDWHCGLQPGDPNMRVTAAGTLDRARWIEGWVATQLFTRGQIECNEHPLGERQGGWWADAFRAQGAGTFRAEGFKTGSKLWALQWMQVSNDTLLAAKQFATEALSYLLMWGLATRLEIKPTYVSPTVMLLAINVHGPGYASISIAAQGQVVNGRWLWVGTSKATRK
jgi:phage gp46-like protein